MSVLFHFSLSFSNYEHRRQTAISRQQTRPGDQESLIRNETADEPSTSQPNEVKIISNARLPKKNFFKTPLLYQNALLYVFSRLFMTTSLVYMPLWLDERSYIPTPPAAAIDFEVTRNSLTVRKLIFWFLSDS